MLKTLYVIAIGLLFAAFIGFGFATFYPEPKYPAPESPAAVEKAPFETLTAEEKAARQAALDAETKKQSEFQAKSKIYNRNISMALIGAAIVFLAVALLFLVHIDVIGDGITLGSIFLLFYGIGRSFGADDPKFQFITVSVGLLVLLFLSWWKFTHQRNKQTPVSV